MTEGAKSYYAVEKVKFAVIDEFEDELAEEAVLPGEPFAGEVGGIVLVETLVYEAGAGVGSKERGDAVADLIVAGGSESPHHYGHGPDHVVADMGAADSLTGGAAEEAGVVFGEDKAAGVLIYGVGGHFRDKVREG